MDKNICLCCPIKSSCEENFELLEFCLVEDFGYLPPGPRGWNSETYPTKKELEKWNLEDEKEMKNWKPKPEYCILRKYK